MAACQTKPSPTAPTNAATDVASAKTTQTTASWRCLGTEPFWAVEIENGKAIFELPEKKEAPITLTAIAETNEAAAYSGENLKIRIKKETCSDGMSDNVYDYSAEIEFGKQQYKGCATKK